MSTTAFPAPIEALTGKFRPVEHPPSLATPPPHLGRALDAPVPVRRALPPPLHNSSEAFICDSVLTRDECAHYIAAAERTGFMSLEREFPQVRQ